jgi:hypothetical protein
LESRPQTLLGITVKLASVHPPIDGAYVPDTTYVGGELAADEADQLLDNLRRFSFGRNARETFYMPKKLTARACSMTAGSLRSS